MHQDFTRLFFIPSLVPPALPGGEDESEGEKRRKRGRGRERKVAYNSL